jgi:hypothetical protein
MSWAPSYVAMSVALGEPLDEAAAALDDETRADAAELLAALRAPKGAKARAAKLAAVLAGVARELDAAGLA